jgi:hypothetical protein
MSFGEKDGFPNEADINTAAVAAPGISDYSSYNNNHHLHGVSSIGDLNLSKDEEGTQNTSISSLSAEGGHHHHLPHLPAHEKLLFPEEAANSHQHNNMLFGYSDDEGEDDNVFDTGAGQTSQSRRTISAGGTRLDFNGMLSPSRGREGKIGKFIGASICISFYDIPFLIFSFGVISRRNNIKTA